MIWVECKGRNENQVEVQVDLFTRDRDLIVVTCTTHSCFTISKKIDLLQSKERLRAIDQPTFRIDGGDAKLQSV